MVSWKHRRRDSYQPRCQPKAALSYFVARAQGRFCWEAGGDQGFATQFSPMLWEVFPATTFSIKRTSAGGFMGLLHVLVTVQGWASGFRSRSSPWVSRVGHHSFFPSLPLRFKESSPHPGTTGQGSNEQETLAGGSRELRFEESPPFHLSQISKKGRFPLGVVPSWSFCCKTNVVVGASIRMQLHFILPPTLESGDNYSHCAGEETKDSFTITESRARQPALPYKIAII